MGPATSRSMVLNLRRYSATTRIPLHATVENRFCSRCSQVYVPGKNCHVKVEGLRRKRRPRTIGGPRKCRSQKLGNHSTTAVHKGRKSHAHLSLTGPKLLTGKYAMFAQFVVLSSVSKLFHQNRQIHGWCSKSLERK